MSMQNVLVLGALTASDSARRPATHESVAGIPRIAVFSSRINLVSL